ncbi:MAG: HlyC/CorC family transporter [Mangrovicoccus sp.]|nr:HlyC/CorC family transporter [Mangrovicoccus sp.]
MMDAEGSSTAAQSAQDFTETSPPNGFWRRVFSGAQRPALREVTGDGGALAPVPSTQRPALSNLRWKRINDVAVPKGEIVAVPAEITLPDLVEVFRDSGFTRLPVYEGTLDMPVGMIHLKDVALNFGFNGHGSAFDLKALLRPLIYVPPSMTVGMLLQKMQSQRMHMALVIDEYGGTDGLVTIEDLIEQVIGEIADEHDVDEDQPWTEESPGTYLAMARAPLDDFQVEIGRDLSLPDSDDVADTLGGLVFLLTGRVPARGEVIRHPAGIEIEVVDADPRRVKRLRIQVPRPAEDAK